MDEQRRLLDELMGVDRDLPPDQRVGEGRRRKFSDPEVCKYYLCGLSPLVAFRNTKAADDVYRHLGGDYNKICDDACKAEWDALPREEKDRYGYEYDLMVLCERLAADCDRRIDRAQDRIAKENAPAPLTDAEKQRIEEWTEEIKRMTKASEDAAEEGDIDAAENAVKRVEVLTKMKSDLERSKYPGKILSVCQISGVFMSSTDNEQRKQDHYQGKQYQGWKAIREKLQELKDLNPPPAARARNGRAGPNGDGNAWGGGRDWDRGHRHRGHGHRDGRGRHRGNHGGYEGGGRDWDRGKWRDDRSYGRDRRRSRSPPNRRY